MITSEFHYHCMLTNIFPQWGCVFLDSVDYFMFIYSSHTMGHIAGTNKWWTELFIGNQNSSQFPIEIQPDINDGKASEIMTMGHLIFTIFWFKKYR